MCKDGYTKVKTHNSCRCYDVISLDTFQWFSEQGCIHIVSCVYEKKPHFKFQNPLSYAKLCRFFPLHLKYIQNLWCMDMWCGPFTLVVVTSLPHAIRIHFSFIARLLNHIFRYISFIQLKNLNNKLRLMLYIFLCTISLLYNVKSSPDSSILLFIWVVSLK